MITLEPVAAVASVTCSNNVYTLNWDGYVLTSSPARPPYTSCDPEYSVYSEGYVVNSNSCFNFNYDNYSKGTSYAEANCSGEIYYWLSDQHIVTASIR